MPDGPRGSVIQSIHVLFSEGSVCGLTDGQLLEQFLSQQGEIAEMAFAALVRLHGPMVWDVCSSVLSDSHAAEDAFQATFLILVRKASSIRRRDAVGPWLYGVARRVAVRAKAVMIARRRREGQEGTEMEAAPGPDPARREQMEALHEEVDRLAEKYRTPLVLCYFEGRTHAEAARLLRCPVGTVSIRLSRARERLRARLTRRGLLFSAAWMGAMPGAEARATAIPAGLVETTIKAAIARCSRQGDHSRGGPGRSGPTRGRRNPEYDLHETDAGNGCGVDDGIGRAGRLRARHERAAGTDRLRSHPWGGPHRTGGREGDRTDSPAPKCSQPEDDQPGDAQ